MKEVNATREEYWKSKLIIEEQRAYIEDRFIYGTGGERNMEKKTVSLQRDKLYEEIWTISLTKVAKQYDVPYQKLKEACEKSKIPLPTPSYWGNLSVGKTVEKIPLPPSDISTVTVTFSVKTSAESVVPSKEQIESFITNNQKNSDLVNKTALTTDEITPTINESLGFLTDDERFRVSKCALQMSVDPKKRKLHPVLMKHKTDCETWNKKLQSLGQISKSAYSYRELKNNEPPFCSSISTETFMRLYHILDTIYSAIEKLGGSINSDLSVKIRGENVSFAVSEIEEQVKHTLTKEELKKLEQYEKDKKLYKYTYEPKFQKYDYLPTGRLAFTAYRGSHIRDTTNIGLENRVGEILIGLYMESEAVRIEREANEAAIRKAEEEKHQKELHRQRYNDEIDKLNVLKQEVADFELACRIRAYITAVEEKPVISNEQKEYIEWAKAKADWYDPTKDVVDPILGKKNHNSDKEPEKIGTS